jgi:hypothetical protein
MSINQAQQNRRPLKACQSRKLKRSSTIAIRTGFKDWEQVAATLGFEVQKIKGHHKVIVYW